MKPRQGRHHAKMSLLTELGNHFDVFLQRCRAYGAGKRMRNKPQPPVDSRGVVKYKASMTIKINCKLTARFLVSLLICSGEARLLSSPTSDLSSSSQEVRDAAAAILRTNYTATARTNWEPVIHGLKKGMTKTNILELLAPYKVADRGGFGGGGTYNAMYQLDDAWMLNCWYHYDGDILFDWELSPQLRAVWVAPPTNFTGTWTTYFANGQKSHEIHYDAGKYHGDFTAFNPEGKKSHVQHYDHYIMSGEAIGFYPSGRMRYRGTHNVGKQVGTWIWYNEDGSTNSVKDHSK